MRNSCFGSTADVEPECVRSAWAGAKREQSTGAINVPNITPDASDTAICHQFIVSTKPGGKYNRRKMSNHDHERV
jgi:hypothetical protein